ncbi:GntR family transcriptional regulator [Ferdinandcohnia quinoae]|uniref:GntR family transcriptional regulator n=1 Tax=Fredinandcohnia quinoae TaxID=2918902 RepID=A0AAW5EDY7_9BACI|nr:GntR family transcriptional regulator [Fredinandcohnia sp. SECRCQ15]MCH1626979.1 GntR family transcriptional regulator [Fredinandcohnia sp. SECRCQ15]
MYFQLDERSNTPIWEQIVNQIKELILKGVLQPNDKLLSVRELSSTLLVNPNTVSKAYQELERQGVIESRRGKGTFVSEQIPTKIDDEKVDVIKQSLKLLIVKAAYLGIEKETFMNWIEIYFDELGGGEEDA